MDVSAHGPSRISVVCHWPAEVPPTLCTSLASVCHERGGLGRLAREVLSCGESWPNTWPVVRGRWRLVGFRTLPWRSTKKERSIATGFPYTCRVIYPSRRRIAPDEGRRKKNVVRGRMPWEQLISDELAYDAETGLMGVICQWGRPRHRPGLGIPDNYGRVATALLRLYPHGGNGDIDTRVMEG